MLFTNIILATILAATTLAEYPCSNDTLAARDGEDCQRLSDNVNDLYVKLCSWRNSETPAQCTKTRDGICVAPPTDARHPTDQELQAWVDAYIPSEDFGRTDLNFEIFTNFVVQGLRERYPCYNVVIYRHEDVNSDQFDIDGHSATLDVSYQTVGTEIEVGWGVHSQPLAKYRIVLCVIGDLHYSGNFGFANWRFAGTCYHEDAGDNHGHMVCTAPSCD